MATAPEHEGPCILAIDAGTSALKAVVYDVRGRIFQSAARRYDYRVPQPGWAEGDPAAWWAALEEAIAELRRAGPGLDSLQAIGLTGQMHTAILLDDAGQPITPTILWLDRRAAAETDELRQHLGLPPHQLNSTCTLPKLLWIARHKPRVMRETRALLWPKDYLRWRLTGELATDHTEAAGAALLDWERRDWATGRLALCGLSDSLLPPLRLPDEDAGALLPAMADRLGLPRTAKVIIGAGDVIALVGGAPPEPGRLSISLGSSAMLSLALPDDLRPDDPRHRIYLYPFLPYNLLNGVLSTSGAALTWAVRALYGGSTPLETALAEAAAIPPGSEGLLFLPFLGGERSPYWSDALRGGFYGLTLGHDRAHMIRAVMEGVACSLRHLLDIFEELAGPAREIALSGGGAEIPGWPQIIADAIRRPLAIYAGQETVTRGLFAYALSALDQSSSFDAALRRTFGEPRRIAPQPDRADVYDALYSRYRELADAAAEAAR